MRSFYVGSISHGDPIWRNVDGKWLNEKGEEVNILTKTLKETLELLDGKNTPREQQHTNPQK